MNSNGLNQLYIILGAGLLVLACQDVAAQVAVGPVDRTLDRTLGRLPRLEDRLESRVQKDVEDAVDVADTVVDGSHDTIAVLLQTADDLAANGTVLLGNAVSGVADAATRPFVPDVDPDGRPIEKNVLVLLVNDEQLGKARAAGMRVISERRMEGLGLTMLTLDSGMDVELAEKVQKLTQALPYAAVDYNHLYRLQQGKRNSAKTTQSAIAGGGDKLRIGLIDSAVKADHPALEGHHIERHDFVTHDAGRPLGHGTAVASLLVDAAGNETEILAASVFFQLPQHAPGASTESLVAALDWLAQADVDVINMSLSGPANALLERALEAIAAKDGPPVVAAVGNNGPAGEPMYPGAYESVIAVTAVDRDDKVFRYANRGEHVDFAALGVNVKVADAAGSYRLESGTSMAAPRVTAVVAGLMRRQEQGREALVTTLINSAQDLGQRGFDPVFGHGLVTALPLIVSDVRTSPQD